MYFTILFFHMILTRFSCTRRITVIVRQQFITLHENEYFQIHTLICVYVRFMLSQYISWDWTSDIVIIQTRFGYTIKKSKTQLGRFQNRVFLEDEGVEYTTYDMLCDTIMNDNNWSYVIVFQARTHNIVVKQAVT